MAKTYEVGDGTCTFGVFSTESKAKAHLKKLKAEGKRAKIYVNHDAPDAPKDETGSKKKASKPKTPKRCTVAADSVRSCCETGVEVACEEMGLDHAYYHVQTEKGTDGSVDVRVADEQGNTVMFTVVGKADGFEVRVFKNNGQIMKRLQFPEDGLCDGLKGVAFGSVEALNRKFPQKRPKKAPVKPKAPKKNVLTVDMARTCCETGVEVACREMGLDRADYQVRADPGAKDSIASMITSSWGPAVIFSIVEKADGFIVNIYSNDGRIYKGLPYAKEEVFEGLKAVVYRAVEILSKDAPKKKPKKEPPVKRFERNAPDYRTCPIPQLVDALMETQEVHIRQKRWKRVDGTSYPEYSRDEMLNILSNPILAPDLCEVFLGCYASQQTESWQGWDPEGIDYEAWKQIKERLNRIRADAYRIVAESIPSEEEPKKGLFGRKKSKTRKKGTQADGFKKVAGALSALGMNLIPVYQSEFFIADPPHVCGVSVKNSQPFSMFGFPAGSDPTRADSDRILADIASYTDADGNFIEEKVRRAATVAPVLKPPKVSYSARFEIDARAFEKELDRARKITRLSPASRMEKVTLKSDGHDLYIIVCDGDDEHSSDHGLKADVGDIMSEDRGWTCSSYYSFGMLKGIARLMKLADTPCILRFGRDYPLQISFSVGTLDMTVILAPMIVKEAD